MLEKRPLVLKCLVELSDPAAVAMLERQRTRVACGAPRPAADGRGEAGLGGGAAYAGGADRGAAARHARAEHVWDPEPRGAVPRMRRLGKIAILSRVVALRSR